jgi:hypothetical protein
MTSRALLALVLVELSTSGCRSCTEPEREEDTPALRRPSERWQSHGGRRLRVGKEPAIAEDSELGFRCEFHQAYDGRVHCLVPGRSQRERGWGAFECKMDASCTMTLEICGNDPGAGAIVEWPTTSPVHRPSRLERGVRFAVLGEPAEWHYPFCETEHGCKNDPRKNQCIVRSLTRELDLTDFVGGVLAEAPAPSDARLRARFVKAEDGALIPYDYWDSKLKLHCRFGLDGRGVERCLPYHTSDVDIRHVYADPECKQDAAYVCPWAGKGVPALRWRSSESFVVGFFGPPRKPHVSAYWRAPGGDCQGTGMEYYRHSVCRLHPVEKVLADESLALRVESKGTTD